MHLQMSRCQHAFARTCVEGPVNARELVARDARAGMGVLVGMGQHVDHMGWRQASLGCGLQWERASEGQSHVYIWVGLGVVE